MSLQLLCIVYQGMWWFGMVNITDLTPILEMWNIRVHIYLHSFPSRLVKIGSFHIFVERRRIEPWLKTTCVCMCERERDWHWIADVSLLLPALALCVRMLITLRAERCQASVPCPLHLFILDTNLAWSQLANFHIFYADFVFILCVWRYSPM